MNNKAKITVTFEAEYVIKGGYLRSIDTPEKALDWDVRLIKHDPDAFFEMFAPEELTLVEVKGTLIEGDKHE